MAWEKKKAEKKEAEKAVDLRKKWRDSNAVWMDARRQVKAAKKEIKEWEKAKDEAATEEEKDYAKATLSTLYRRRDFYKQRSAEMEGIHYFYKRLVAQKEGRDPWKEEAHS